MSLKKTVSGKTVPAKTISPKISVPIVHKKQNLKRTIAFSRATRKTASLPLGQRKITQTGHNGLREIVLDIATQGKQELSRKRLSNRVVMPPKQQVELIGIQRSHRPKPTVSKTDSSNTSSSRRRSLRSQSSSTKKYVSHKTSRKRSLKKLRSPKKSSQRTHSAAPSNQVLGTFRTTKSFGD